MKLLPAIDLSEGKAVRLVQGDYRQKTVYHEDPMQLAAAFARAGAEYLHVVDLDGAKAGEARNGPVIEELIRGSGLKVEAGGGIRTPETVGRYLSAGAWRVILGTAAVEDPALLKECIERYGEHAAVGVDIRDGRVMTRGWLAFGGVSGEEFFQQLAEAGIREVICTDISRDGMLQGANLELYGRLHDAFPEIRLTASGGISRMEELEALEKIGMDGAIIGKALYTGAIDLAEAVQRMREKEKC